MESSSAKKSWRLIEIIQLLGQHPEGLKQSEIARRLGVHRSTISRDLVDLQAPIYKENGRLFIDPAANLLHLNISLHEALALHLATRLLTVTLDRQNPHAASALRKISLALEKISPPFSRHIACSADVIDEYAGEDNSDYVHVLEALTLGWARGRKVRVFHRHSPEEPTREYLLSPYYIEPSAWGRSTYVIGLREPPGELRTFKVERLESAAKTDEPYEIPAGFDPFKLLEDAWGIWYTQEKPVKVVLRFRKEVAKRVLETHWHRSQEITPEPSGSLLWSAQIAAPQEMVPWIRGWGKDVEVLEPPSLREAFRIEVAALAASYGWQLNEKISNPPSAEANPHLC